MASKNLDTFRNAHQLFNKRDYDAVVKLISEDFTYEDHATGIAHHGRKEFKEYMQNWVASFSDANIKNPKYTEAGDTIIAQFTAAGTNDGTIGNLRPTNKKASVPFCEIMRFNNNGQMISCEAYYDQMSLMVQTGHLELEGVHVAT